MYVVKLSQILPALSADQVEAKLAADAKTPDNQLIRCEAEHVLRSAPFHAPLIAQFLFRAWSHRADVRAGRTRVRLVQIGGR